MSQCQYKRLALVSALHKLSLQGKSWVKRKHLLKLMMMLVMSSARFQIFPEAKLLL